MGTLSDILNNSDAKQLRRQWDDTEAAENFVPLPSGEYVTHIIAGNLFTGRTNTTPGYKLTIKVLEGDHTGRQFWHDIWLTPAALPMAKRDLGKLGVVDLEQLERPLPPGIRCSVKLALRQGDDGSKYNRVRRFDVLDIDEPERDAFAPTDDTSTDVEAVSGSATREADESDKGETDTDPRAASAASPI